MERLRRFILESAFNAEFASALYGALGIFEAVSINKDFLMREAGGPDALRGAKARVADSWAAAHMEGVVRGGNLQQKLFNFLYLMEIRRPGFVNNDVITKIHDISIHGSLEQKFLSKVDSDTQPDAALAILNQANESAVQAAKPYPSLKPSEEKIWNRVRVYHEFPDGFKWVYAINADGTVSSYMPSSITAKTMNHCGNQPSKQPGDEYWELRDSQGKAYLTVILSSGGKIEESKSWGNQPNKYRQMILPYVKWFLKDKKVTGVGHRYNHGYATHMNFGVKDFIGDDPEFIDYVLENKDALIGDSESRILFWQDALKGGYVTVDNLKDAYKSKMSLREMMNSIPALNDYAETAKFRIPDESVFGYNSFAVICAACSGNPFTEDELKKMIANSTLTLEVFANYNIRYLTPEIQEAFVKANPGNLKKLIEISNQVASFKVANDLWRVLLPSEAEIMARNNKSTGMLITRCDHLIDMLENANPPAKMADAAKEVMANQAFIKFVYRVMTMTNERYRAIMGNYDDSLMPAVCYERICAILGKYPDLPLPEKFAAVHAEVLDSHLGPSRHRPPTDVGGPGDKDNIIKEWLSVVRGDHDIGGPRNNQLLAQYADDTLERILVLAGDNSEYPDVKWYVAMLCDMFGPDRINAILTGEADVANPSLRAAMGTTIPDTDEYARFAREMVHDYFYGTSREGRNGHVWNVEFDKAENENLITLDLLLKFESLLDSLDWKSRYTYAGMSRLMIAVKSGKLTVESAAVGRLVVYYIRRLSENFSFAKLAWADSSYDHYDKLPNVLVNIIMRYDIKDELLPNFFRRMAEYRMRTGSDNLPGAWRIFTIPFDEWGKEYKTYGFPFVRGYAAIAPADTMLADEFITNFICDKLVEGGESDEVMRLVNQLCNAAYARQKSCVARTIAKRIKENTFPVSQELFFRLYSERFINAEAYRTVMGRREDRGAMEVRDTETVSKVIKTFNSMQKMDTLPELIASTFGYIADTLYEHMGDGRFRWKVDEDCSEEVSMLGTLATKLVSKARSGNVPKAIKKLYDDGIIDRLREFPNANRAACEDPSHPKSKISCFASTDIDDALYALDKVKEVAFAAATEEKPAKQSRRKPATAK